jgi:CheY-like chemotaxis protein
MVLPARHLVLVVEDQPPLRGLIAEALQAAGYDVAEAWNGVGAIEQLTRLLPEQRVCVVLLDLRLPYVDGLAVLRHLTTLGDSIPVIAVSADPDLLTAATQQGAQATLAKPFDLDALLAAVARYCPLKPD